MNTRPLTALSVAVLLALSASVWAQENSKEPAKPADQAQMKKQCEDMKHMDMSKMSPQEHEAMMKRCRQMMERDKEKQKPKASGN